MWGATHDHLSNEGYTHRSLTHTQHIHNFLHHIKKKNAWTEIHPSVLCLLYLIAKAKSLVIGTMLWRPRAAVVEPTGGGGWAGSLHVTPPPAAPPPGFER